jgi:hypothetical protein
VPCRNTEVTSAAAFSTPALVLGGHAGCGLEQAAEQDEQFPGGEVAAERAVVDAA